MEGLPGKLGKITGIAAELKSHWRVLVDPWCSPDHIFSVPLLLRKAEAESWYLGEKYIALQSEMRTKGTCDLQNKAFYMH